MRVAMTVVAPAATAIAIGTAATVTTSASRRRPAPKKAQRLGEDDDLDPDGHRPPEPLHPLALEPCRAPIAAPGAVEPDGHGDEELDPDRPQRQHRPVAPHSEPDADRHEIAAADREAAQPAGAVRQAEQDVHRRHRQDRERHRRDKARHRDETPGDGGVVGVGLNEGRRDDRGSGDERRREHEQRLALLRPEHEGESAGDREAPDDDRPDHLSEKVAAVVDHGRGDGPPERHRGEQQRRPDRDAPTRRRRGRRFAAHTELADDDRGGVHHS